MSQICIAVHEESQVGEARRSVATLADALGFAETERGRLSVITTELSRNLAKYGKDGRLFAQGLDCAAGACLEILAVDAGAGMANVARCLEDGYSTGGTAGTGLGGVRRLASEFDIYSQLGMGTVVMARVARAAAPVRAAAYQWGAVATSARGEVICGDGWRVAERNGTIAVMMADGLGHGPLANEAAERAAATFEADPFGDPSFFLNRAHTALQGGRGAAVATARTAGLTLHYAGIGNISGSLHGTGKSRGLFSHNGTVGVQMRPAQQLAYDWLDSSVLVMHSDGLTARWTFDTYPGLIVRHPAIVAAVLHRDCLRGRDDATVVVVRSVVKAA